MPARRVEVLVRVPDGLRHLLSDKWLQTWTPPDASPRLSDDDAHVARSGAEWMCAKMFLQRGVECHPDLSDFDGFDPVNGADADDGDVFALMVAALRRAWFRRWGLFTPWAYRGWLPRKSIPPELLAGLLVGAVTTARPGRELVLRCFFGGREPEWPLRPESFLGRRLEPGVWPLRPGRQRETK